MSAFDTIVQHANNYVAWDPNEETKAFVEKALQSDDRAELTKMFTGRLQFGTAGLRAAMGAGYNKMNELVVLQTSQGLAHYLASTVPDAKSKGIVIGYDHRAHGTLSSKGFARISAAVFLANGFKVYMLENLVATPFVPFGINHFHAAAGIMVTASHNPKADNGFKVYWGNGAQIIPPHDNNIANAILANLQPWEKYDVAAVPTHALAVDATEEVVSAYMQAVVRLSSRREKNAHSNVKVAYTAMHGVGGQWIEKSFAAFNHPEYGKVPSQIQPDPAFPTVSFPNPEEKGALNNAMKYADEIGATLILANDPDADRLAAAEKNVAANTWKVFSGNEIGALLGYWTIMQWKKKTSDTAAVLASIVSSRMLKTIAKTEGLQYFDTLTGFKWLGNKAMDLRAEGTPVLFSYEEALGYCVGDLLCDKDGVSGAPVFYEMASALSEGWTEESETGAAPRTVADLLQFLSDKYGAFISYNSYVLSYDSSKTDAIFANLRTGGESGGYWSQAAGQRIVAITDVTKGYDSTTADHSSSLPVTPDSHMIMYEFENGVSVTLRTSGTEPKIKYYTEIAGKPGQSKEELTALLHTFVDNLVTEMLQPEKYGLVRV